MRILSAKPGRTDRKRRWAPRLLLCAAVGLASPFAGNVVSGDVAFAQQSSDSGRMTVKRGSLKPKTAETIEKALEAAEAERYDEAIGILQRLLKSPLSGFEKAKVTELMGTIHAQKGDFQRALKLYEEALAMPDGLDEPSRIQLNFNLGGIYLSLGQYERAVQLFEAWFAQIESPGHPAYFALAQAYALTDRFSKARTNAERAYELATPGAAPKRYFQLLVAIYFELKQYARAEPVLEVAVSRFATEKPFWDQLRSVYQIQGKDRAAFTVMELTYKNGFKMSSSELVTLAEFYRFYGVPIKAAQLLEREMASGRIEPTSKNYELLANSYLQAREWKRAREPLRKAAETSADGDLFYQLGQSYVQDEEWPQAERALVRALNKGNLQNPGNAWVLLGIARYSQEKVDEALESFENATKFDSSRSQGEGWIEFITKKRESDAAFEEALSAPIKPKVDLPGIELPGEAPEADLPDVEAEVPTPDGE